MHHELFAACVLTCTLREPWLEQAAPFTVSVRQPDGVPHLACSSFYYAFGVTQATRDEKPQRGAVRHSGTASSQPVAACTFERAKRGRRRETSSHGRASFSDYGQRPSPVTARRRVAQSGVLNTGHASGTRNCAARHDWQSL
ncbi:hypothetical protein ERJ75_001392800 [Trypanosoma vivax]|nr:hypothetical protein ERJ75_001392800 [Trypanosoma vivax]